MTEAPDRNLGLELVRATESAAMAAARWMGKGDKNESDRAAVNAMRYMLNTVDMDGIVVIGEGEKDKAPMLYNGEVLGKGVPPQMDIAVDPIDGTRLLSLGRPGAISVVGVAERGSLFNPEHVFYFNKIAVGPRARGVIDITAPVAINIRNVAKALDKDIDDITVVVLDRPRHQKLVDKIRHVGARIRLITDGDVSGALMTAKDESGIDMLMGIGGAPEAIIAACALKCVGGDIQCAPWAENGEEMRKAEEIGLKPDTVLTIDDMVKGDNVFFAATGITDGELLSGVKYNGNTIRTYSIVMRSKSGTVRYINSIHRADKLMRISEIPY